MAGGPEKLRALQALRAIAAILVTVAHASEEAEYFFGFEPLVQSRPLGRGVDLFFVISGFIIYHTSQKLFETPRATSTFLRNRVVRVVPLYFLFTTLMVLTVFFLPQGVKEARFDIGQIASSYLFVPYERYDGRIAPILSLGWTLNYEAFFYALFSGCLSLRGRYVAPVLLGLVSALALLGTLVPADAPAAFRAWTNGLVLEFGMGVGLAWMYERRRPSWQRSAPRAWLAILAGFAMLYVLNLPDLDLNLPRFIAAGVPSALIVGASVLVLPSALEQSVPRWLVALGDSSYSLYLSHRFVQRPLQMLLSRSWLGTAEIAGGVYVLLATLLACGAGHVVYLAIERPLLSALRKGSDRARASTWSAGNAE